MRKVVLILVVVLALSSVAIAQLNAQDENSATTCRTQRSVIAEALGMDEAALGEALDDGTRVADLAEEQGVELSVIAEALAANLKSCELERIDATGAELMCRLIDSPQRTAVGRWFANEARLSRLAAVILDVPRNEIDQREQSLAELAEAHGMSSDVLVDELVDRLSAEVYRMTSQDQMSQEDAEEILSTLEADVEAFVMASPADANPQSMLDMAVQVLGMGSAEFYQALASGQTLAELAASQDVDAVDLITALVDAAASRLEQAREDGSISDCVADVRQRRLEGLVEGYINRSNPPENLVYGGQNDVFQFRTDGGAFEFNVVPPDFRGEFNLPRLFGQINPRFEFRGELPDLQIMPPSIRGMPGHDDWDFDRWLPELQLQCEQLEALPDIEIFRMRPGGESEMIRPRDLLNCEETDE